MCCSSLTHALLTPLLLSPSLLHHRYPAYDGSAPGCITYSVVYDSPNDDINKVSGADYLTSMEEQEAYLKAKTEFFKNLK